MSNGSTSGGDCATGNFTTDSSIVKPAQIVAIVAAAAAVGGAVGAAIGALPGKS